MSCQEAKTLSLGGALDASETSAKRGGIAEYVHRGEQCNMKFSSYTERYKYLRGKSACNPSIPFPCCTPTTMSCGCTEPR